VKGSVIWDVILRNPLDSQQTFRRKVWHTSSGPGKNKAAWSCVYYLFHEIFLLDLLLGHEDRGDIFFQNFSLLQPDFNALYPVCSNLKSNIFIIYFTASIAQMVQRRILE
jgi:hypothetical protein